MEDDRLRRLATELSPAIANYLRRRLYPLGDGDLDDLVEETFLVIWRRIDDVPPDAELAWSLGVARNVLRNSKRARLRRSAAEARLRPQGAESSAEAWVLASASVRAAMRTLSASDRELLLLYHWDGLDVPAIAVALTIIENAANVRLSRAHARLRRAYEDDGSGENTTPGATVPRREGT